jgi:hypothetical protein
MSESYDSSKEFENFSVTLECPLSDGPMAKRWSTQFDVFYSYLQDSDITGGKSEGDNTVGLSLSIPLTSHHFNPMI